MTVYTRCGVCGKEGRPEWDPGSSTQQMQSYGYISPSWRNPKDWNDVLGVLMCGDCCSRVRGVVREMAQPPKATQT